MVRAGIKELAEAAMRLHGASCALELAVRYAANASAENNNYLFRRWTAVANLIAEHQQREERLRTGQL